MVEAKRLSWVKRRVPDTNVFRQSLEDHASEYAPEAAGITDKNGLLELLRASMETSEASIREAGDKLQEKTGFQGQ